MSPTSGMYHSRPTDLVIRCIAVGLENAFELSQEPLRPIASATQAEIEHHGSSGATVLPEIRLVILSSALACLHIDWGFIRLNVATAHLDHDHDLAKLAVDAYVPKPDNVIGKKGNREGTEREFCERLIHLNRA